jgi:hypothetical protein
MAGPQMFQAVQHTELGTLGQVAIRDYMKKRARYLRLVAQNNNVHRVSILLIVVVASRDLELLQNFVDMRKIHDYALDEDHGEYSCYSQARSGPGYETQYKS